VDDYISGGSPSIQLGSGDYLTFFHSVHFPFAHLHRSDDPTEHAKSATRWYSLGCLTFEGQPPFRVRRVSPKPIEYPGMFDVPNTRVTRDDRVVFPGGVHVEGSRIYVAIGENDSASKILVFDLTQLLDSLVLARSGHCKDVHDRIVID
jgi:hypothetical protein